MILPCRPVIDNGFPPNTAYNFHRTALSEGTTTPESGEAQGKSHFEDYSSWIPPIFFFLFLFFLSWGGGRAKIVFLLAPSLSCSNLFQSQYQVVVPLRPFPPVEADSSPHFLNLVIRSVCDPRMPLASSGVIS